ncbi:hypothetical protein FIU92_13400 [Ruegeria sp. THAF33]|nr:hypothetical protein FIU92_13400 [Ruegeria sp. THAF33]
MTAEQQIWIEALKREKNRVEKIHKKSRDEGKKSSAQFLPERVPQPWVWSRSGPGHLSDFDDAFLLSVTDFDYDLDDQDFVQFLKDAAQLHICRARSSTYWHLLQTKSVSFEEFGGHPELQFAQEYQGKRHRYSEGEMYGLWRIFLRTRVYLQGAYDSYRKRQTEAPTVSVELKVV